MLQHYAATALKDLPPGRSMSVTIAGRHLALFNVKGRIFAIDGKCPHHGAPLTDGIVKGSIVTCPWHGAEFDLTNGSVLCPPAVEGIQSYPVFLNGDSIEVEL
ncbi:MAG TPA: non-heme iron oxygenase ferredoxin subunit [Opitutaceae bacterium]|nr:non-heme iron oxygenase ferredoxin subunit [Opitutaceae bacterium]